MMSRMSQEQRNTLASSYATAEGTARLVTGGGSLDITANDLEPGDVLHDRISDVGHLPRLLTSVVREADGTMYLADSTAWWQRRDPSSTVTVSAPRDRATRWGRLGLNPQTGMPIPGIPSDATRKTVSTPARVRQWDYEPRPLEWVRASAIKPGAVIQDGDRRIQITHVEWTLSPEHSGWLATSIHEPDWSYRLEPGTTYLVEIPPAPEPEPERPAVADLVVAVSDALVAVQDALAALAAELRR
jgi:hypothetical protein